MFVGTHNLKQLYYNYSWNTWNVCSNAIRKCKYLVLRTAYCHLPRSRYVLKVPPLGFLVLAKPFDNICSDSNDPFLSTIESCWLRQVRQGFETAHGEASFILQVYLCSESLLILVFKVWNVCNTGFHSEYRCSIVISCVHAKNLNFESKVPTSSISNHHAAFQQNLFSKFILFSIIGINVDSAVSDQRWHLNGYCE